MYPDPYYIIADISLDEFILGMLTLGTPLELALVGVFDTKSDVRGSRRDIELPLHQDGKYSQKLAEAQGGTYVEAKDIDIVGLYCLRDGEEPCYTLIGDTEINLESNQALILDNNKIMHGRKGPVGNRILVRMWLKCQF